jgi:RNA polymerase sigma-70 factor (ECF subfamily)
MVVLSDSSAAPAAPARAATASVTWPEVVHLVTRQMESIVGPSSDREDLTQSALEHVVRALERFEGRAELSTFTYRVCARVALNHWRGFRRWLRRFQLGMDASHEEIPDGRDVSALALERERARALHAALERMDPMRRLVVTLSDLEDLPGARIAEILECPEATVRSRLRRGRGELYALLAKDPLFCDEIDGRTR